MQNFSRSPLGHVRHVCCYRDREATQPLSLCAPAAGPLALRPLLAACAASHQE